MKTLKISLLIILFQSYQLFSENKPAASPYDTIEPDSKEAKILIEALDSSIELAKKQLHLSLEKEIKAPSSMMSNVNNSVNLSKTNLTELIKEKSEIVKVLNKNKKKPTLYNFDYKGGSIQDFARYISETTGNKISIVLPKTNLKLEIFPFKLNQVNATTVFHMLNTAWSGSNNTSMWLTSADNVWVFTQDNRPQKNRAVEIKNVSNLIESYNIESITTAIKASWEMQDIDVSAEMKFHPGTKLLILKGSNDEISIANAVLIELRTTYLTVNK